MELEELRAYLGVGEEHDGELAALREAAVEGICRATGIDWRERPQQQQFLEAVRAQMWLSFYGVRDAAGNTAFLERYLEGLLAGLQLCREEGAQDAL